VPDLQDGAAGIGVRGTAARPLPAAGEPVDLVIFDCDGVLVDSERLAVRVEARLLSTLGWDISEAEVVRRFVGRSDAFMRQEIERTLGRPVPEWDARYAAALSAAFRAELRAVPGVVAALDRLTVPSCVASSGTHEKMRLTLGLTGLLDRFAGRISSATEVARGKPAPDLFLHAASRMGVAPARCVVVEDSAPGVQAARAAGMRSLGYAGGLTPPSWLEGPGTVVFDDMADLDRLVASLAGPSSSCSTD
jgi:HAD superfamily hydrolase (TIGR01509 family)